MRKSGRIMWGDGSWDSSYAERSYHEEVSEGSRTFGFSGYGIGGQSGEVLRSTAKLLSSTAYDRTLESEADKTAVFYLLQSGINPEPFGEFLFRLSKEEELPSLTEWVSTHPDSEKRSIQICNWAKEGSNNIRFVKILSMKTWKTLQQAVSDK